MLTIHGTPNSCNPDTKQLFTATISCPSWCVYTFTSWPQIIKLSFWISFLPAVIALAVSRKDKDCLYSKCRNPITAALFLSKALLNLKALASSHTSITIITCPLCLVLTLGAMVGCHQWLQSRQGWRINCGLILVGIPKLSVSNTALVAYKSFHS